MHDAIIEYVLSCVEAANLIRVQRMLQFIFNLVGCIVHRTGCGLNTL